MIRDAIFAPLAVRAFTLVAVALTLGYAACQAAADDAAAEPGDRKTVAGRTVQQYANDLDSENRVVRLRAAKSLGAFGQSAAEPLRNTLQHDDPAMRYTAAVHLGLIGGDALKQAEAPLQRLAKKKAPLTDRMAAAFALSQAGYVDQHLETLIEAMNYPNRGTACSAAELIGYIGPEANAAIEPLKAIYEQNKPGAKGGDYHVGGAAKNALRKINRQTP